MNQFNLRRTLEMPALARPKSQRADHFYGLDLLRFFAALIVVMNHFAIFSAARPDVGEPFAYPGLNFGATFGWVGVEIFFVISGFVIPLSAQNAGPGIFVKRRLVRVFPALWICSLISFLALLVAGFPWNELLPSLFRSVILSPKGPYVDGVVWTLVVEAAFYILIWATLLNRSVHAFSKVAEGLGIASALFLTLYGIAKIAGHSLWAEHALTIMDRFVFKVILLHHGVFFALGMTIWLSVANGFDKRKRIFAVIMTVFCVAEIAFQSDAASPDRPLYVRALPILIWCCATVALVFSIIFQKQIGRKLEAYGALVKQLGLLTFPLYLNHYTIGRVMVYYLASSAISPYLSFFIAFTIILGSSWLITRFAEPAVQSRLRALLKF